MFSKFADSTIDTPMFVALFFDPMYGTSAMLCPYYQAYYYTLHYIHITIYILPREHMYVYIYIQASTALTLQLLP